MLYLIWSHALMLEQPGTPCCYIGEREWNKVHNENEDVRRIFAKITLNDKTVICPLGEPIREALIDLNDSKHCPAFIPLWAFDKLTIEGLGSKADIQWCSEEFFPEATRIVLRPHSSTFYESNIKDELEVALTEYGVLQLGMTVPIKIKAINNIIDFDIVALEPASIVLMQGDDVAIEFEKTFDEMLIPDSSLSEGALVAPKQHAFDDDMPMVPTGDVNTTVVIDGGHVLGGKNAQRLADGRVWNHWRNR